MPVTVAVCFIDALDIQVSAAVCRRLGRLPFLLGTFVMLLNALFLFALNPILLLSPWYSESRPSLDYAARSTGSMT